MDKWIIDLLSTPGGFIMMLGVAIYLISRGVANVISKQGEYIGAQAKERDAGADAQENINKTYKDLYESLEKKLNDETERSQRQYSRVHEATGLLTEQVTHLTEQVNQLTGEKNALYETNKQLAQDNYKISTDLGVATESRKSLLIEIDALKTERARLQKALEDCSAESAKERDAFNVQIQVKTARIAALESELAEKNAPSEPTEIKINAAITLESPTEPVAPTTEANEKS